MVTKRIELRVRAELPDRVVEGLWQLNEPHRKTPSSIEFRYNDSSWCAGNFMAAQDPANDYGTVTWEGEAPWAALEVLEAAGECLCNQLSFKFVRVVDATPRRKLKIDWLN